MPYWADTNITCRIWKIKSLKTHPAPKNHFFPQKKTFRTRPDAAAKTSYGTADDFVRGTRFRFHTESYGTASEIHAQIGSKEATVHPKENPHHQRWKDPFDHCQNGGILSEGASPGYGGSRGQKENDPNSDVFWLCMTIPAQTGISAKTVFLKSVTVTLICRQKIPFLKKIRDGCDWFL